MSVIYFTNNADNGDGSLRTAIALAQSGDVIRPDASVFDRGSPIVVDLIAEIVISKNITLDASPYRVKLNGGTTARCASIAADASADFIGIDFIDGYSTSSGGGVYTETSSSLRMTRCVVAGCASGRGGGGVYSRGLVELNDCIVTGCVAQTANGGGLSATGALIVNGSTVVGNATGASGADVRATASLESTNSIFGDVSVSSAVTPVYNGVVANADLSTFGFVAPPVGGLTVENWSAVLWRDWDLHLLDDASTSPSIYRDAGVVDERSTYDVDGNFRGREANGVATRSPGAYETIQSDLFWVGVDSNGATVETPSFLSADGWATSRFAVASGDTAPQAGDDVFVDGVSTFSDAPSERLGALNVGGYGALTLSGQCRFIELLIGFGGVLVGGQSSGTRATLGDYALVETNLFSYVLTSVGKNTYINRYVAYYGDVSNVPEYGTLRVAPTGENAPTLTGEYHCRAFVARADSAENVLAMTTENATVVAETVALGDETSATTVEHFFTSPVRFVLQGTGGITTPTNASGSWANDFYVDVSFADDATLKLCGQVVYGASTETKATFEGVAKIDSRGLTLREIVVGSGASLHLDDGKATVETATFNDGSQIIFSATNTNDPTGVVLTATDEAIVGSVVASGAGYFVAPKETDLTLASLNDGALFCALGAGATSFKATSLGSSVAFEWTANNADVPVLIEHRDETATWKSLGNAYVGGSASVDVDASGNAAFRLFDGEKFLLTSIYVEPLHVWLVYDNKFSGVVVVKSYKIVTECLLMSSYFNAGESPIFLARIVDSASNVPVKPSDVETISLTVYKQTLYRGVKQKLPLNNWNGVDVPITAVMENLVTDDARWTQDETGYNFRFEPNLREKQLFTESGDYAAIITIRFKEGNPAPIVFNVSVK